VTRRMSSRSRSLARPLSGIERRHDALHVGALAAAVSTAFFRNFYDQGAVLLYGDAVAHIHIARRVFDSITPGPLRLGTVWLPLPHVLMMPFLLSDWMWRTGVGGSIVSMLAYVAGTVGIFRLLRSRTSAAAGWFGAAVYALNPNLIYLQATAMTESLYVSLFVWAIVFLNETVHPAKPEDTSQRARSLERAAILLAAAMLTRYDGWWLTGCVLAAAFVVLIYILLKRWQTAQDFFPGIQHRTLRPALRNSVMLLAAIATLWLAYNHREYGNSLEFANGPYSAQAIVKRTAPPSWHHPGENSPRVAALYFLKAVKLNLGSGHWQSLLLLAAVYGLGIACASPHFFLAWLLLWLPLPFYILSIAYGHVPLYVPVWWPFANYNVRYGVELLPAVAVFGALSFATLRRRSSHFVWRAALAAVAAAVLAGSYISAWKATPITLQEAVVNSRTRIPFERALADVLRRLPPSSRLLMFTGAHPGALQMADIHLRRVVNESNHPQWEQALNNPSLVDYVIASDDDPVAQYVARRGENVVPLSIIQSSGQPRTTIYKVEHGTQR
jgi:hypothetical protein